MKFYTLKAAPAAGANELKNNNKSAKAKRILAGCDVHLRGYQAARKVDNGAIGVVDNFRSEEALLLYIEKQRQQAEHLRIEGSGTPLPPMKVTIDPPKSGSGKETKEARTQSQAPKKRGHPKRRSHPPQRLRARAELGLKP